MQYKIRFIVIVCFFACIRCTKQDVATPVDPCLPEKAITIPVVNDTFGRIRFNSSETFLKSSGERILRYDNLQNPSFLFLVTDKQIEQIDYQGSELIVRAFIGLDSQLFEKVYLVNRDSCHVNFVEGDSIIIIK